MRRFAAIWLFLLSALLTLVVVTVWMEHRNGADCGNQRMVCYDSAGGMEPWLAAVVFGVLVALGLASTLYWAVQIFRRRQAS